MFISLLHWHFTLFHNAISLKLVIGTYGWSNSCVQWKKHPRNSPWTFLPQHTFLTWTMKRQQNAILLSKGTIFSILLKYWQVSKYTAMLSEFSFPKKGKELSLSFEWQIYVMVELRILWSYGELYIWKSELIFSIRQMKLFWINLKHCSQTCSNEHLCKTTTDLR